MRTAWCLIVVGHLVVASGTKSVSPFSWSTFGEGHVLQAGLRAAEARTHGNKPATTLKQRYPWYLTGEEILSELKMLDAECNANVMLSKKSTTGRNGESVTLDVVHIRKSSETVSENAKKKAFFVFGEHARELISPQTGLQFMRMICGQRGDAKSKELANRVLASTDFVIVPNANPVSRTKVEAGQFCQRTNEDGVDLNRNWGEEHLQNQQVPQKGDEMNPGPSEFSEPETQILRDLVVAESPDVFVSVHSGAYLLGTPFGYTDGRKPSNEQDMLDLLKPISQEFCKGDCPFGDLAGMISYKSPGCDIDFVKDTLGTPYVFTWEIYAGPKIRRYYAEKAHASSEGREMSSDAAAFFYQSSGFSSLNFFQRFTKSSLQSLRGSMQGTQVSARKVMIPENSLNPADCFNQFNPETKAETEEVAENWSKAFLTLCDEVSARKSNKKL